MKKNPWNSMDPMDPHPELQLQEITFDAAQRGEEDTLLTLGTSTLGPPVAALEFQEGSFQLWDPASKDEEKKPN